MAAAPTAVELLSGLPEAQAAGDQPGGAARARRAPVRRPAPIPAQGTDASTPTAAELAGYEAVQLFVERAQAVRPDFHLTERERSRRLPTSACALTACRWRSSWRPPGSTCSHPKSCASAFSRSALRLSARGICRPDNGRSGPRSNGAISFCTLAQNAGSSSWPSGAGLEAVAVVKDELGLADPRLTLTPSTA